MANTQHYIAIDESGEPGKPFEVKGSGTFDLRRTLSIKNVKEDSRKK